MAEMSEKTKGLLLKFRKGATASFGLKDYETVLAAVGGWKVEKVVEVVFPEEVPRGFEAEVFPAERGVLRGCRMDGPADAWVPAFGAYLAKGDSLKEARAAVAALREKLLGMVVPAVPAKAKKNAGYVLEVGEIAEEKTSFGGFDIRFPVKLAWAAEGVRFTAPGGASLTELREPGYRRVTFYKTDAFLKANGLLEEVLAVLDMPAHEPADPRTLENTGTCGCCGGNYKLRDGRLVLHGYERPGYGYVLGSCFGVGYEPHEVSPKCAADFLAKVLLPAKAAKEAFIAKLNAGEITELTGGSRLKPVTVKVGEKGWAEALNATLGNAESELESIARDVEVFTARVAEWKPDLMPLEKMKAVFEAGKVEREAMRAALAARKEA